MFRKLFIALSLVFTCCLVHAQTTISASDVSDSFNHPIAAAKLCFAPVDATGTATGFRVGSIQVVTTPVCGLVSNGVMQSGLTVVPTPSGVYYHITANNRTSNAVIRDYGMTQITGSSWTLDSYDPSTAVLPVTSLEMGTVTTLPPGDGASCGLSGASPILLNCSIPQGATGATGATGAAGGGADPLLTAQYVTHPWDAFDAGSSGTLINGRTSPSGFVWDCQGAGYNTAFIANGGYNATANTYCVMTDTQPVTEADVTFNWPSGTGDTVGIQGALIYSSAGTVTTGALIHLTYNNSGWNLLKSTGTTGASDLIAPANPWVEVDGLPIAMDGSTAWLGGSLPMNGRKYTIRMLLSGSTLTLVLPDGTTWQTTDPDFATWGSSLTSVIWQNGEASGQAPLIINAASIGPTMAGNVAAANPQDHLALGELLYNHTWTSISPTADGWYTIATHLLAYPVLKMGGTVKIYGYDPGGRTALFAINVGAEDAVGNSITAPNIFSVTPYLGTWAGGVVDQVRLSNNSTNGYLQLDIHVATPNYSGTQLAAEFDGYFTPVNNPAVGATALGSWSVSASTSPPPVAYSQTFTGGAGWYTAFIAGSSGGYAVDGDFQILASNSTLGSQAINFHVYAYTGACSIWQTSSTSPSLITQARCSYSSSTSPYIQIDLYDTWSSTYPLTLTGNLFGVYTVNGSPTVGATVLGGGSQTLTLVSGTGLTLTGITGTITGTALSASCDSGTASVPGAVVGSPVSVSSATGADVGAAFYLRASVTSTSTITVYVCGTGTPASLAYNVTVF